MSDPHMPEGHHFESYLLGDLPADEMERLDRRLISDPDAFEAATAAEDDLIDAFVRGELSRRDQARFRRRLLPSERIARRVAAARALDAAARRESASADAGSHPDGRTDTGTSTRAPRPAVVRWAWAATVAALVGGGVFAWQTLELRDEIATLRARSAAAAGAGVTADTVDTADTAAVVAARDEIARLRQQLAAAETERQASAARGERIATLEAEIERLQGDLSRLAERPAPTPVERATFALALATRSDTLPELRVPAGVDQVELELDLDDYRATTSLDAVLIRRGVPVWTETGLPVGQSGQRTDPGFVRLRLPIESLGSGTYGLRLTAPDGTLVGAYDFTVVRP